MRILGIDPGYERVGIAVVEKNGKEKEKLVYSVCFKTDQKISFDERLFLVGKEIARVCEEYSPELLSIETIFFNTNQKTAVMVAEARGVILYEAKQHNLKVYEYSPLQIKNAVTGYGRATKDQVNSMVKQLVTTQKILTQDDEIDAVAAALTCFASYKNQVL